MTSEAKQQGKGVEHGPAGGGATRESGAPSPLVIQWMAANYRLDATAFASLFPMQKTQRDEILTYLHAHYGNGFVVNGINKALALTTTHEDPDAAPNQPTDKPAPKAEANKAASQAPGEESPGWGIAGAVMFGPTLGSLRPSEQAMAVATSRVAMAPTGGTGAVKGTEDYGARSAEGAMITEDVRASIEDCPQVSAEVLLPIWEDFKKHWPQYAQLSASFVAVEVAIAAMAVVPDPTGATKAIALVLQALVIAVGVVAAVTASDEVIDHGKKWWELATSAHGNPTTRLEMRNQASHEFALMLVKAIQALLAIGGGVTFAARGLKFAGRDAPVTPSPVRAEVDEHQGQVSSETEGSAQHSVAEADSQSPPSTEEIHEMEHADRGKASRLAERFVQNPNTTYHHYLTKGGLREIAKNSRFNGGDGTASFGGKRAVRAWIGSPVAEASRNAKTPVVEFTTTAGEIPNVRPYQGRMGAYWLVDELPVNIKSIRFPDGSVAVPDGSASFRVTFEDGRVTHMTAQELPE